LRRDDQVRAEAAEFARHAVADLERNGQSRGRDGHAHNERGSR